MLILTNSSTDKLQLTSASAITLDIVASWVDYSAGTATPGRSVTAMTTATTSDIVATPAASTTRNVKEITIRNKHASGSTVVTALLDNNGTDYEIYSTNLRAGETLEYIEGVGWFILASSASSGFTLKALSSDYTNSTTTLSAVSGLTVTADVGNFFFRYGIIYQSAATTTGIKLSANHTGTVTEFVYNWYFTDNLATAASAAADQDAVAATAQVFSVFAARAKSTTGAGTSISVDTANSDMFLVVEGMCIVTVSGNLELWAASEVGASQITIKDGSSLILTKCA